MHKNDIEQRLNAMSEAELRECLTQIIWATAPPDDQDEDELRMDGEEVAEHVLEILTEWNLKLETEEETD